MTGMSVGQQLINYSIVTPHDPAKIGSGGLGMNGLLSVNMRNTYESGFQRHLEANNIAQVGDKHECCSSGSYGLSLFLLRLIQNIIQRLVDDLVEDGFYRHEDVERLLIWLGWKPGRLDSMPEKFQEMKKLVAQAIGGQNYGNAFGDDCPMERPKSYKDCHACKKYTKRQRRGAVANTEQSVIIPTERNGDTVRVLDACEEGFKVDRKASMEKLRELGVELDEEFGVDEEGKMPSMLLYLLARDTSESFGLPANSPHAPRWRVYRRGSRSYNYWRDLGFIAMHLACPDKKLRLLLFVVPWCRMGFHKPGLIMGFKQMERGLRSSCSSTATGTLLDVLCSPRTAVDRSLDRPVGEIPVVLFGAYILHLSQFSHITPRYINPFVKSFLSGDNHLGREFQHMMKKGYFHLISSTSRKNALLLDRECEDLGDEEGDGEGDGDDDSSVGSVHSDEGWDDEAAEPDAKMPPREEVEKKEKRKKKVERRFLRNLLCRLTRSNPGDKKSFTEVALPSALHYLMHNRNGERMSPDAIYQRLKLVKASLSNWCLLLTSHHSSLPSSSLTKGRQLSTGTGC
mmetsp:Transcript_22748/g.50646  ORF Transcript_22748/g.50646 Transcript_22748/m.50646 type:complete len:570 (-) Transcript_22748:1906-3615(-)